MYEISEGKFQPFPIFPGSPSPEFDFRREFGRREGKKLSRDLFDMLNYHPEVYELNLSFVIPLSIAIFGKHNYGKEAEKSAKESLSKIIESFFDPERPTDIVIVPDISLIRAGGKLALYEVAFGRYPMPEEDRNKILSKTKTSISSNLIKGGSFVMAANGAQRYLSMGGEPFWTEEITDRMLRELQLAFFADWKQYQSSGLFRPNFATFVLAYKVLRSST